MSAPANTKQHSEYRGVIIYRDTGSAFYEAQIGDVWRIRSTYFLIICAIDEELDNKP